jgi:hypothetical protein
LHTTISATFNPPDKLPVEVAAACTSQWTSTPNNTEPEKIHWMRISRAQLEERLNERGVNLHVTEVVVTCDAISDTKRHKPTPRRAPLANHSGEITMLGDMNVNQ